ncbi:MAG: hypothetical protein KDA20_05430 [Phycisphaerales bacterium]|nr:hypothetical protein [Phycisphaerales bacterium]
MTTTMLKSVVLSLFAVLFFAAPVAEARWYDAKTGRWITRDPLAQERVLQRAAYPDGSSRYQYVRSNPVRFVDFGGLQAQEPEDGKAAEKSDAQVKCEEWAAREAKRDQTWISELDDCPCQLDMTDPSKPKVPCDAEGEWNKPEDTDGRWHPYHPNATWQVRGKAKENKSGQQCTYDQNGKLITDGPSAGTPDLHSPHYTKAGAVKNAAKESARRGVLWVLRKRTGIKLPYGPSGNFVDPSVGLHQDYDVHPFVACRDAGMLDVYFTYRPPSKGKNPDGTPCAKNTVDPGY